MAAYKQGDWLQATQANDVSSSDSESDDCDPHAPPSELNARLKSNYRQWLVQYDEELMEFYSIYVKCGNALFSKAFDQFGNFETFTLYVFRTLQPGADNLME